MGKHFPNLLAHARRKLAERGIDPDASCDALMAECLVQPPPRLLRDLGLAPIATEREIDHRVIRKRAA